MVRVISDVHGDREFECEEFDGYVVRHILDADGKPPLSSAQTVFGMLWYAAAHPTLIFSSAAIVKKMIRIVRPELLSPAIRLFPGGDVGCGLRFNNADWVDHAGLTDRVYMLNEKYPDDPKYNGYYTPYMG